MSNEEYEYISTKDSLKYINELDLKFDKITSRISNLDHIIEECEPNSLDLAFQELKLIINELNILKQEQSQIKFSKILNFDVDNLIQQTTALHNHLMKTIGNSASLNKSNNAKLPQFDRKTLLTRDEVAKLLLAVQKAFQLGKISAKQKSHLKDQICSRSSYLRLIVQQDDIHLLIGALKSISGEW